MALHVAWVATTLAIGCSSQSGKPGGAGGMGGAVATGCTDPLMIDDMEDGDGFICATGSPGRHGEWFTTSDGTSTNLSPSPTGPFTQTLIPGGRGTSRYAALMTGSGFRQGAGMAFYLNGQGTAVQPYDASATQGIRFWMKSNVPVVLYFSSPETITAGEAGGTCVDSATEFNCDNPFGFIIATPNANEWVEYYVPYSAGTQTSRLDANNDIVYGSATWNPSRLLGVEFDVGGLQSFEVWIDDIRFYSCDSNACVPTCTDPNAPVACPAGVGYPAFCWPAGAVCSAALPLKLLRVWGNDPNDVWAVGSRGHSGAIVHWDGSTWSVVPGDTSRSLSAVWGTGPADVWAAGNSGTVLRWDGSAWSVVSSGTSHDLRDLWGSSSTDVWAVGGAGTVLHWDGSVWSAARSGVSVILWGVWGSGPNDIWAVGDSGTVIHWDGTGWSRVSNAARMASLAAVWGSGTNDVWAVGGDNGGIIVHWNGSAWSVVPSGPLLNLYGVGGSGPNDAWAVGIGGLYLGAIFHWDGSAWSPAPSSSDQLFGIWGSSTSNAWATGTLGTILHWNGATWSAVPTDGLR